jgi:hypothetical protein
MDERRRVLFYELTGIVFIIVFGSILHFTFEWSGGQAVVGAFSAVNESVWEHLKLGFWPAVAFALIEFRYLKKSTSNFLLAKTVSIYLIPITIVVIFYSYTAILGESVLAIDILSFILAVIVGQLVGYRVMTGKTLTYNIVDKVALIALILLGLAFVVFTFLPPQLGLFQDPITGGYGIVD